MNEIWLVLLSGILADNIICNRSIGIVGGEFSLTTFRSSLFYSLSVCALSLVSTAVCYPIMTYLLGPIGAGYLYILVISGITALLLWGETFIPKNPLTKFKTMEKTLIFATSLGICSLCLLKEKFYLALIAAIAYGIGLLFLMLIFFCAKLSLKESRVPHLLRNTAIDLIIVAIIALVFQGFR